MTPRRRFRPVHSTPALDPATFVRRVATKVGTPYGRALVHHAFGVVQHSAFPDEWIRAVQQARADGTLDPAVAHFLIYKLAESAMLRFTQEDATLADVSARIEAVERAHGLDEDESFTLGHAPAEWTALTAEWDARYDALLSEMFRRVGEEALAADPSGLGDALFEEGRLAMFGPIEEWLDDDEEGAE